MDVQADADQRSSCSQSFFMMLYIASHTRPQFFRYIYNIVVGADMASMNRGKEKTGRVDVCLLFIYQDSNF